MKSVALGLFVFLGVVGWVCAYQNHTPTQERIVIDYCAPSAELGENAKKDGGALGYLLLGVGPNGDYQPVMLDDEGRVISDMPTPVRAVPQLKK